MTAAAVLGAAGHRVVLADPTPPVTDAAIQGADLRTTAILQPGRQLMERAGIWEHLAPKARPLAAMRIVDAAHSPVSRDFEAQDMDHEAFGWNLANTDLRAGLLARLDQLPTVQMRLGLGCTGMTARDHEALVQLSDGSAVAARLVVACDGRNSPLRQRAGIAMTRHAFGQKAIVFAATHTAPHDSTSTEIHHAGGPFTLVPLPDHDGAACSGIVWMNDGPEIARLAALSDADFAAEATARSAGLFGPLQVVSPRQVWPIISQYAERLYGDRLALAAEAAHVLPPIGAQGLNMSLADIDALTELVSGAPDPGAEPLLRQYHRKRWPDIRMRIAGVDLLNAASRSAQAPVQRLRAFGIKALHDVPPLRHLAMRMGLGSR